MGSWRQAPPGGLTFELWGRAGRQEEGKPSIVRKTPSLPDGFARGLLAVCVRGARRAHPASCRSGFDASISPQLLVHFKRHKKALRLLSTPM